MLTGPGFAHGTHDHSHDDAAQQIHKGYFQDGQVQHRALSDWVGEWQSVYPYLTSGALDPVMADKAAHGDKTAADYRAYYDTGYRTDVDRIAIQGDSVTFHRGDQAVTGQYADDGYVILAYEKGNRGVRYVFAKTGGDDAAPRFIQFSDHRIAPEASDHYHLYWGDDRDQLLTELSNWPTYYPADLTADQIVAEMLAH
ncbi:MAG: metal-binding protein ZinT [Paracoccus sp. (in: a-proteobacteria)]|uniref:ZinT family metal-binding protein n=1 Tax=Paracoccus sp. TaxID=267 RepID=UPI0026DED2DE|nr:metal-binding protein ZinT [Paracoccus sp. (in: a-proteobacteria)]MDO5612289.1 metal-binding protein ZinT [Paracoccus sp. (in: a-proteobacteria)]